MTPCEVERMAMPIPFRRYFRAFAVNAKTGFADAFKSGDDLLVLACVFKRDFDCALNAAFDDFVIGDIAFFL